MKQQSSDINAGPFVMKQIRINLQSFYLVLWSLNNIFSYILKQKMTFYVCCKIKFMYKSFEVLEKLNYFVFD